MDQKNKRRLHLYIRLLENQLLEIGARVELLEAGWKNKENLATLVSLDSKLTRVLKQSLYESSIMGLCRVTDPSLSPEDIRRRRRNEKTKKKGKGHINRNLNIELLIHLIEGNCSESKICEFSSDLEILREEMSPLRLRRNKILGHTDLSVSVKPDSMLSGVERLDTPVTVELMRNLYDSTTGLLNKIRGWHSDRGLCYDSYMHRRMDKLCNKLKGQPAGGGGRKMNPVPDDVLNAFCERKGGFGLRFFLNDCIRVKGREGAKSKGSVIEILEYKPNQIYYIEYSDFTFDSLPASEIREFSDDN